MKLADRLVGGPPSYQVWMDRRELRPGEDWDEQIEQALRDCKAVLFVLSNDSVNSLSGCKHEWARALRDKKPVIPLRLHADADLPFRLGSRQYVDFTPGFDAGLAALRLYLAWNDSPEGQLQELKIRLADAHRELPRATEQQRPLLQTEIANLTSRIKDHPGHHPDAADRSTAASTAPGLPTGDASEPLPRSDRLPAGQTISIETVHGDNINVAGDYRRNG